MKNSSLPLNELLLQLLFVFLACQSPWTAPAQDDTNGKIELELLSSAAGVSPCFLFNLPVGAPVTNCEVLVEGYKMGKAMCLDTAQGSGKGSLGLDAGTHVESVRVCVCSRGAQAPEYKVVGTRAERVPGSGSTRLGYAF